MGAQRLRRACALLACGATLLLNVWRLVARQGDAPEVAAACALARQLELALPLPPSENGSDAAAAAADDEVRLFWWHRFEGHRRAVRTPERFTCADGLSCVSDSRTSAFAAAHGVVIWSGPDHRRGECLPPQRPAHTWVLEFSEPPTVDARTEAELYSEAFAQRFEVKVWRALRLLWHTLLLCDHTYYGFSASIICAPTCYTNQPIPTLLARYRTSSTVTSCSRRCTRWWRAASSRPMSGCTQQRRRRRREWPSPGSQATAPPLTGGMSSCGGCRRRCLVMARVRVRVRVMGLGLRLGLTLIQP